MLVLALAIAYLVGSFPTGVVLSQFIAGDDVRGRGSGNPGASNVARTYGLKLGAAVGAIDIVKGLLPVLLARRLGLPDAALCLIAFAAVFGHDYSLFLQFRGGKGVASTLGAALGLAAFASVLGMVIWVGVIVATGYSSLASLIALAALPVFVAITGGAPAFVAATFALFLLALWKHRENVNRLWNGTERKFRSLKPVNGA